MLIDLNDAVGTDATIAEHISKIIDREYVMRQKQGGKDYLVPSTLGIGLVEGYNRIGFDKSLSKPHLRAEVSLRALANCFDRQLITLQMLTQTEQRMALICAGQRTKADVLNETIEEYKEVYMKTKQQMQTLIDSVRQYVEGDGNAGPPGPPAGGGNVGGNRGNGNGGGNHRGNDNDEDDDSDGDGRGALPAGRGRGGARGGRGGRGGGAASTVTRQPAARAPPAPRGVTANRGGRGGDAGPSRNIGRSVPKAEENDENRCASSSTGKPLWVFPSIA